MFNLQVSPWELLARAALIYTALLVMVRISGKRTVGQFTPFDLLVVMLLSEAVSNGLSGGDDSVLGAWILAATLIAMNAAIAFVGSRSKRFERLVEGSPVLIGRDGRWFEEVLRRHRLSDLDVEKALREADCAASELKIAMLESDGSISIVKND